jgi:hypothetical protein
MQDLTAKYAKIANLVPSSMSTGNTMSDDPSLAMTAPGSKTVNPKPDKLDNLPLPVASDGQIPLSNSPDNIRPKPTPHPGGGTFALPSYTGAWKDTESNG